MATLSDEMRQAGAMWGLPGRDYDLVSLSISDALKHAAERLAPRPGDHVLDIATGTGWSARNMARMGAEVTAVDISEELLEAGRALSAHAIPPVHFMRADACALPFEDDLFDGAISTFGLIFAPDHKAAAAELARVLKPGARAVLATWTRGGSVEEFFAIFTKYTGAPPPGPGPMDWGDPAHIEAVLGPAFDVEIEQGTQRSYFDHVDAIWDWYFRGFGPVKATWAALDGHQRTAFRADIDAYHRQYGTALGLAVERGYLVVRATLNG